MDSVCRFIVFAILASSVVGVSNMISDTWWSYDWCNGYIAGCIVCMTASKIV